MKVNRTWQAAALALLLLGAGRCKKNVTETSSGSNGYLLGYRTAGTQTADYLVKSTSLDTGVISATGTGKELTGWNYYSQAGSTYFAMDYTNNICTGFQIDKGVITEKGRFAFERMDVMGTADANTLIAIGAPWGGGSFDCQIQLVDAQDISIHKNVKTPIYVSHDSTGAQLNAWPTHTYIDGNKLYVAFYPLNGVTWETPLTDTALVSVYSYPDLTYLHTFKDTRTGPIGYYGGSASIVTDEVGNHYTFSTSSIAGGFTRTSKPSGILRINSGQDQFDPSYFFDVEAQGYRILTGTYAGGGKVVARVIDKNTDAAAVPWMAFSVTAPVCRIAIIDLNAKTLQIVGDVPLHGGQYQTPFHLEGGKVAMSINNGTDAYVYKIDPATATATKGARIEGSELQSFFKY